MSALYDAMSLWLLSYWDHLLVTYSKLCAQQHVNTNKHHSKLVNLANNLID